MSQQAQETVVVPRGSVYAVMAYARSAGDLGLIGRHCLGELQRWLDAPVSPLSSMSELDELAALKSRVATIMQGECECCVLTRAACADAIAEIEIGRRNAAPVSPDSDLLVEGTGQLTRAAMGRILGDQLHDKSRYLNPSHAPKAADSDLLKEAVDVLKDVKRCTQGPSLDARISAFLSKVEERGHD